MLTRPLWIGAAENAALLKLAADCERAARRVGLKPEKRKFAAHVTIAYLNNARQIPMLPDWALVSTVEGRDSQLPGTILAEGFFDEQWQP